MLMFPLLVAGQIMHPSHGVLTGDVCVCVCVCVCVNIFKMFLNCCYKVNMILKVTKNRVFILTISVINCLGFLHINL
jgi:hypothetical protein